MLTAVLNAPVAGSWQVSLPLSQQRFLPDNCSCYDLPVRLEISFFDPSTNKGYPKISRLDDVSKINHPGSWRDIFKDSYWFRIGSFAWAVLI